ncbi:hypothetical protein M432DRAFT_656445 [Thermoascus aurantiacus ATCC 26904]
MSDDNNTRKRTFDIFNEDNGDTTQFPTGYINDDNNNNNIEGDTDAQNTGLQDTLNEGESSNANIVGDDNAASDLPHKNDDPHNIEASASQNAPREGDPGTGQLQAPLQLHLAGQNVVTNTVAQGTTNTAAQGTEQPQGETQERPAKRPRKSRRRKDEEEPDYSAQVRERLRNNTRTGQACDRCKERKMKCDPGQNSCANCLARKLQCYVTDRITGETYARGYMNKLREENAMLRAQLAAALNELQYCQSLLHGGLQRSEAPYGNLSYRNQDPFQMPTMPTIPTTNNNSIMDPASTQPGQTRRASWAHGQNPFFVPNPYAPMTPVNQPQTRPSVQPPPSGTQYRGIVPPQPSSSMSDYENPQPLLASSSSSSSSQTQGSFLDFYDRGFQDQPRSRGMTRPAQTIAERREERESYFRRGIVPPPPSLPGTEHDPRWPPRVDSQGPSPFVTERDRGYQPQQQRQASHPNQTIPESGHGHRQEQERQPPALSQRPQSLFDRRRESQQDRPRSRGGVVRPPPTIPEARDDDCQHYDYNRNNNNSIVRPPTTLPGTGTEYDPPCAQRVSSSHDPSLFIQHGRARRQHQQEQQGNAHQQSHQPQQQQQQQQRVAVTQAPLSPPPTATTTTTNLEQRRQQQEEQEHQQLLAQLDQLPPDFEIQQYPRLPSQEPAFPDFPLDQLQDQQPQKQQQQAADGQYRPGAGFSSDTASSSDGQHSFFGV